jgi:hypothetical protein
MALDLRTDDTDPMLPFLHSRRWDRCEGQWRNETFHDPSCQHLRREGPGGFCNPVWLKINTKVKLD